MVSGTVNGPGPEQLPEGENHEDPHCVRHCPGSMPKVTGRARYAEDFRVEGMVFCRLLPGPVALGRVTR